MITHYDYAKCAQRHIVCFVNPSPWVGGTIQPGAAFAPPSCLCQGFIEECFKAVQTAHRHTQRVLDDLLRVCGTTDYIQWTGRAADLFHTRVHTLLGTATVCSDDCSQVLLTMNGALA